MRSRGMLLRLNDLPFDVLIACGKWNEIETEMRFLARGMGGTETLTDIMRWRIDWSKAFGGCFTNRDRDMFAARRLWLWR